MFQNRIKSNLNFKNSILGILRSKYCLWIPDRIFLHVIYLIETGSILNLKNPSTYNEKLQWLKLFDRKPEYAIWSDKYLVRTYIANAVGQEYLIPLINIYDSASEIDFSELPDKFVFKVSNGSGTNIVCNSKSKLNINLTISLLNKWMSRDGSRFGREWVYRIHKPKILAEKFIGDNDGMTPKDYKFMCFNGKARLVQVHNDRFGNHTNDFYDINWNKTDIAQGVPNSDIFEKKPKDFEKMVLISEKLALNTKYCRIDFYYVDEKIYFGEITMYPTSGFCLFNNYKHDLMLGSWLNLE